MIPKIIHYCWLSKDTFPKVIADCIVSWKKNLTDYEFVLWYTNKFNLENTLWVKQTFKSKKYAFAADYVRHYAFYHYRGIYMDTTERVDSSATATLAWFLINAARLNSISENCTLAKNKAINYLMTVTRRDGSIDFSQGDTKGIGVYSQEFDILPFTQGFCLRTLNW